MTENLIGLIPAAGKAVRLGLPYPKELYPIIRDNHYKPVAQYVLENLAASGVRHVVFVINETKHQLIGYFGDGSRFGCNISYVVQEQRDDNNNSPSPGLAHALNSAYHLIRGKTVFFGMPDTIMTPSDSFFRVHEACGESVDAMLGLYPTVSPQKFGMVDLDQEGRVRRVVDKPAVTDLQYMWGLIIWRANFTEHLNACLRGRSVTDFAGIMNLAISGGMSFQGAVIPGGSYVDLGTYEDIANLERQYRVP